jgi:hypothetical protein
LLAVIAGSNRRLYLPTLFAGSICRRKLLALFVIFVIFFFFFYFLYVLMVFACVIVVALVFAILLEIIASLYY